MTNSSSKYTIDSNPDKGGMIIIRHTDGQLIDVMRGSGVCQTATGAGYGEPRVRFIERQSGELITEFDIDFMENVMPKVIEVACMPSGGRIIFNNAIQ